MTIAWGVECAAQLDMAREAAELLVFLAKVQNVLLLSFLQSDLGVLQESGLSLVQVCVLGSWGLGFNPSQDFLTFHVWPS